MARLRASLPPVMPPPRRLLSGATVTVAAPPAAFAPPHPARATRMHAMQGIKPARMGIAATSSGGRMQSRWMSNGYGADSGQMAHRLTALEHKVEGGAVRTQQAMDAYLVDAEKNRAMLDEVVKATRQDAHKTMSLLSSIATVGLIATVYMFTSAAHTHTPHTLTQETQFALHSSCRCHIQAHTDP